MTDPDAEKLAAGLGVSSESLEDYRPRYNIAPTQAHFIMRIEHEARELLPARWGLVNRWAKDAKLASRQINARAETVATSRAYGDAFAHRRCAVPSDGFYEWRREPGGGRQPFRLHRPDGRLFFMAGVYEWWRGSRGEWQCTFALLTTAANALVGQIHDRMPVILDDEDADQWMFSTTPRPALERLLGPAPDGLLVMTPVSQRVNKVANDDRELIDAVGEVHRLA